MMAPGPSELHAERVLILAPTGRDAEVAVQVLGAASITAEACRSWEELGAKFADGAGVLIIAQEAVGASLQAVLATGLAHQPPWSDIPVVLLTSGIDEPDRSRQILEALKAANLTLLERPFRSLTLVSVVQGALRSRRRQYQVRELLQQRENLLESERAARADAEVANRMKDEFLAGLSHELRTPLNAILGWCQLMRMGGMDDEELDQGLETIERNARLQAELINDLLDLSRIISGKLRLDIQTVNLGEVVRAAIESVLPSAEGKGVDLGWTIDPDVPPVAGDPTRLQQVAWNLLSNAIKFTPAGGRVEVSVTPRGEEVQICVSDTGMGIPADFLPYVFDRFRQLDGSTTRRHGGLGLGLSIVRQLVELHGGSVRVDSEGEGRGATFCVDLPKGTIVGRAPAAERRGSGLRQTDQAPPSDRVLEGLRVLVVDDDADSRVLLKRLLGERGADVESADSASAALRQIDHDAPDLLISDIGMPEQDGYELIRQVRKSGRDAQQLPAVALTAFARREDAELALRAGFQLHLAKPVNAGELATAVASLAGRTNSHH